MTFEYAKVAKIGKGYFFKLKWRQKNFWSRKISTSYYNLLYRFVVIKLQTISEHEILHLYFRRSELPVRCKFKQGILSTITLVILVRQRLCDINH